VLLFELMGTIRHDNCTFRKFRIGATFRIIEVSWVPRSQMGARPNDFNDFRWVPKERQTGARSAVPWLSLVTAVLRTWQRFIKGSAENTMTLTSLFGSTVSI